VPDRPDSGVQNPPMPADDRAMRSAPAVRHAPTDVADEMDPLADPDLEGLDPTTLGIARFALGPAAAYPVLPAAVAEVMDLANRNDAQFREVDRVVRHDPVLAARVLSVANSPLFRPPGPITSLRVALLRLGWTNLRSILLQAIAEAHVFPRGPRREIASARLHAVAVAHLHRYLAQSLGLDGEHAFACGLLHDLGRPMLFAVLSTKDAPVVDKDVRTIAVDRLHCHVGARVARRWNLPDVVARACRSHHDEPSEGSISHIGSTTIAIAEALADRCGVGSAPTHQVADSTVLVRMLDLPDAELAALYERAAELCRELT
jgi:putative nucleotidyltransferase with HDIG domain